MRLLLAPAPSSGVTGGTSGHQGALSKDSWLGRGGTGRWGPACPLLAAPCARGWGGLCPQRERRSFLIGKRPRWGPRDLTSWKPLFLALSLCLSLSLSLSLPTPVIQGLE